MDLTPRRGMRGPARVSLVTNSVTYQQILGPWDARIKRMLTGGETKSGRNEAKARSNVWEAVGGTPAEIGVRCDDDMRRQGLAFHDTPKGGPCPSRDLTRSMAAYLKVPNT